MKKLTHGRLGWMLVAERGRTWEPRSGPGGIGGRSVACPKIMASAPAAAKVATYGAELDTINRNGVTCDIGRNSWILVNK